MSASTTPRGQSMVEFALVLPVFVLIIVGIFDVGRAIFYYTTILNASREAARLAVVDQTLTHVQQEAVDQGVALGLTAADVTVDYRLASTPNAVGSCNANLSSPRIVGCVAVVRLEYDYSPAVPLVTAIVGPITLSGESRFPVHTDCVGADCPHGD